MRAAKRVTSKRASAASPRIANGGRQVEAYIAELPPHARKVLKQMRSIIRSVAPRATESISYRIPTYKLDGKPLVYCAAFKNHTSLYPMTAAIRHAHAEELKGFKMSTGTVQFPLDRPLPAALIKRLVTARIAEVRNKE